MNWNFFFKSVLSSQINISHSPKKFSIFFCCFPDLLPIPELVFQVETYKTYQCRKIVIFWVSSEENNQRFQLWDGNLKEEIFYGESQKLSPPRGACWVSANTTGTQAVRACAVITLPPESISWYPGGPPWNVLPRRFLTSLGWSLYKARCVWVNIVPTHVFLGIGHVSVNVIPCEHFEGHVFRLDINFMWL